MEERKESAAKFTSVMPGPNVRVKPAQARVSLILLDNFSSFDTMVDNLAQGSEAKPNTGARRPGTTIPGGHTHIGSYCMVSFRGNARNFSTNTWGREENNISSHNSPVLSCKWRTTQPQLYLLGTPGTNKYKI